MKDLVYEGNICVTADKCKKGVEDADKALEDMDADQKELAEAGMKAAGLEKLECVTHSAGSAAVPIIIVIVVLGAIGAVVGLKMKKKACFADKPNEGGYTESMI